MFVYREIRMQFDVSLFFFTFNHLMSNLTPNLEDKSLSLFILIGEEVHSN